MSINPVYYSMFRLFCFKVETGSNEVESFFCKIFQNGHNIIVNNISSKSEQLVRMAQLLLINLVIAVNDLFLIPLV